MSKNPTSPCPSEYDFAVFLSGVSEIDQVVEDALFNAGCDDATLSLQHGSVRLAFSRTATSLRAAILSAIHDVRRAGIGADVAQIDDCNLVTQAEIARKINRSRQYVNMLISGDRGPGGFPRPDCWLNDSAPLWPWCEVAEWLWQANLIREEERNSAFDISIINEVLRLNRMRAAQPDITEEIIRAVEDHFFAERPTPAA